MVDDINFIFTKLTRRTTPILYESACTF